MRKAAYIANALALVLSAAIASGVDAQANDVALARQLFEQGIAFVDEEDWAQAADRFQRSLELRPSPIVAYNLGSALVELGRLVEASEAFRHAIRVEGAPEAVSQAASESLAEVEPRIGSVTITLSGDADGVDVFIDDRQLPRQAIGVAAPLDPGVRRIRAVRDGSDVTGEEIDVSEGAEEEVSLEIPERVFDDEGEIVASPDPVFATTPEEEGGGILSSPWFWIVTGALVAGAVVVVLVLTLGGQGNTDPVPGNLMPAIVEF